MVDLLMIISGVLSNREILLWIRGVLPWSLVKAVFCGGLISIVKLPLLKKKNISKKLIAASLGPRCNIQLQISFFKHRHSSMNPIRDLPEPLLKQLV